MKRLFLILALLVPVVASAQPVFTVPLGNTLYFKTNTLDSSGEPVTVTGTGAVEVWEGGNTTPITGADTVTEDYTDNGATSHTGMHDVAIVCSGANGFEAGKYYSVAWADDTLSADSVAIDDRVIAHIQVTAAENTAGTPVVDAVALSGSSTAADNAEIVFDTDFATAYSTTNDKWQTEADVLSIEGTAASTSLASAADIVDEWESQSQADPTGFHVNVLEIGGTAQTANDNGADINDILADTANMQPKLGTFTTTAAGDIQALQTNVLDKMLGYTQLTLRKDAAIATDRATELNEINSDEGSGAGAYAQTTDSQQALVDGLPTNFGSLVISGSGAVDSLLQGFLNNTIAETSADNIAANFETFYDNCDSTSSKTLDDIGSGSAGGGGAVGTVIYVAASGGNDGNAGTRDNPLATLSQADTNANPGDIIVLLAGTHSGDYDWTTNCVTIIGEGQGNTIISADPAGGDTGDVLSIANSEGITIKDLTITASGATGQGLDLSGAKGTTLLRVSCDAPFDGLAATGATGLYADGLIVSGDYDGGLLAGCVQFEIRNSKFSTTGSFDTDVRGRGLYASGYCVGAFRNCSFSAANNAGTRSEGIAAFGGSGTILFEACDFSATDAWPLDSTEVAGVVHEDPGSYPKANFTFIGCSWSTSHAGDGDEYHIRAAAAGARMAGVGGLVDTSMFSEVTAGQIKFDSYNIAGLPTAAENRAEMDSNSTQLAKLGTPTDLGSGPTLADMVRDTEGEVSGLSGSVQSRVNFSPTITLKVGDRDEGNYKCNKPVRFKAGAVDLKKAIGIDMSPMFGPHVQVANVGTPTVSSGSSITLTALGPRDEPPKQYAMLMPGGTATAGETATAEVEVTMANGDKAVVELEIEVDSN